MFTLKKLLVAGLSSLLLMGNVMAVNVDPVTLVYVDDVSVIQLAMGPHLAGNLEMWVRDGFTVPAGVNCADHVYLTTLKSVDAEKRMLSLLLTAQVTKQRVSLYITDDPAYTAFPGRCSLVAVTLTP